jgi:hypothetical protein
VYPLALLYIVSTIPHACVPPARPMNLFFTPDPGSLIAFGGTGNGMQAIGLFNHSIPSDGFEH